MERRIAAVARDVLSAAAMMRTGATRLPPARGRALGRDLSDPTWTVCLPLHRAVPQVAGAAGALAPARAAASAPGGEVQISLPTALAAASLLIVVLTWIGSPFAAAAPAVHRDAAPSAEPMAGASPSEAHAHASRTAPTAGDRARTAARPPAPLVLTASDIPVVSLSALPDAPSRGASPQLAPCDPPEPARAPGR